MNKKTLIGLTAEEIFDIIEPEGFVFSHAVALANAIYKKGNYNFSNLVKIPKKLREFISYNTITGLYYPVSSLISKDKTIKYLFRNFEGNKFETVFIPDGKRNTVCVSTQSGCRMGCPFCVTAKYGFHGNLSAGDILNQLYAIPEAESITHVVFMGMGEPLDNIENVLKAAEIMTAEWGKSLSTRNITVSSVGITPGVKSFLAKSDCNLTISLYSPFPEERSRVVPAETKYPVKEIIDYLKNYPVKKKRRLSVAYVMIEGINDTDRHLDELKKMFAGTGIRINLLPYHQLANDINKSSSEERLMYFKHQLVTSDISASVRKSRGADISAACGLLASGIKNIDN